MEVAPVPNVTVCTFGSSPSQFHAPTGKLYYCDQPSGKYQESPSGGGSGVGDGDKGAITVSASGTVWTVDPDAIGPSQITADAVGSSEIATNAVGANELDEASVEPGLEAVLDLNEMQGTIGDAQIAAGAIDGGVGGEIQDGTVDASDLATDSVGAAEIQTGALTAADAAADLATQAELDTHKSSTDHDSRYFTETELQNVGTINTGSNPVDWSKLKNVPAGFADGADDGGGGSSAAGSVNDVQVAAAAGAFANVPGFTANASTGAVSTKILNGVFHAIAYGADATGATDSRAGIQAAIDAATAVQSQPGNDGKVGAVVKLAPGRYLVNGPLILPRATQSTHPRAVWLEGEDKQSTVIVGGTTGFSAGDAVIEWEAAAFRAWDNRIADLTIIAPDIAQTHAIRFTPTSKVDWDAINGQRFNLALENVEIEGSNQYHESLVYLEGMVSHARFVNVWVDPAVNTRTYQTMAFKFDDTPLSGSGEFNMADDAGCGWCYWENIWISPQRGGFCGFLTGRVTNGHANTVEIGVGGYTSPVLDLNNSVGTTFENLFSEGRGEQPQIKVTDSRFIEFRKLLMGHNNDAGGGVGNGIELYGVTDSVIERVGDDTGMVSWQADSKKMLTMDAASARNRIYMAGKVTTNLLAEITDSGTANSIFLVDHAGGTTYTKEPFIVMSDGAGNVSIAGQLTVGSFADPEVEAFRPLTSAANKLPYYTGSGAAATTDFSAFARTILDDADQAAVRSTLALTPGTNVQAFDADLTDLSDGTLTGSKVEVANVTTTGVVNTSSQEFNGVKTFDDGIATEAAGVPGCTMDDDLNCAASSASGGQIEILEDSDLGSSSFVLTLGATDLSAPATHTIQSDGRIPDSAVGNGVDDVGGNNTFGTFDTSSGSDPVADSGTDTVIVAGTAPIVVTGDSGTDTITVSSTAATGSVAGHVSISSQNFAGDKTFDDDVIADSFDSPALATSGGSVTIKEGADDFGDGTPDNFIFKVPDSGLNNGVTSTPCTIQADGRIPDSCIGDGIDGGGATSWTDADPMVQTTTTRDVQIGTNLNNSAKLSVDGDADQVQLSIQGNATQTSSVVVIENSAGADLVTVSNTGVTTSTSFDSPAHATDGGSITIKEGSGDGSESFVIKVPDSGLTASGQCDITATGDFSSTCTDYTLSIADDPALNARECIFSNNDASGNGGIVCEGAAANAFESYLSIPAPTASADATYVFPSAATGGTKNLPAIENAQAWTGAQTMKRIDEVEHSNASSDIATALATLPSADGALVVDPTENDTTVGSRVNPAGIDQSGTTTGKKDAIVFDLRDSRQRITSSGRSPWSGANAGSVRASPDDVPVVIKAQYRDETDLFVDDTEDGNRDGDSWSCGPDYKTCSTTNRPCVINSDCPGAETCTGADKGDGPSCPGNFATGGDQANPDRLVDFWYGGHYNKDTGANVGRLMGPGPAIFQVRGPNIDDGDATLELGESTDKPIFSVGTTGAAVYIPENYGDRWYSAFTIYRPNQGGLVGSSNLANTPYFSVNRQGLMVDGGAFFGNTLSWPNPDNSGTTYGTTTTNSWNALVHKDVSNSDAAFLVYGAGNTSTDAEDGPMVLFLSGANNGSIQTNLLLSSGNAKESFGFYENSRLRLAAKCNVATDAGCDGTDINSSQFIEFEGLTEDGNETKLTITEPTGARNVKLPDLTGTVLLDTTNVVRTIPFPIRTLSSSQAGGAGAECSDPAEFVAQGTGGPKTWGIACPLGGSNLDGAIYGNTTMPDGWVTSVGLVFQVTAVILDDPAATETLQGVINAQCVSDEDTASTTWTANQGLDITWVSGDVQYDTQKVSAAAITPDGSCAAGDTLYWRFVVCDPGTPPTTGCSASTHDVTNVRITGVRMEYTRAGND